MAIATVTAIIASWDWIAEGIVLRWWWYITSFLVKRWALLPPSPAFAYRKPNLQPTPRTHNVDIRFYLRHPPAHLCQCFDTSHDPYYLVCAWNAHHEPNGRELRVHSLHFEVPRESTRPKAKHCRYPATLLRRVCYPSTRIHPSRSRASDTCDVPLQIWILYVFSSYFMLENILINPW